MTYGVATVRRNGAPTAVLVRDGACLPLSHWGEQATVPELLQDWDAAAARLAKWADDSSAFETAVPIDDAEVMAPYVPGQVFCTGANYKKHVVGLIMGDPSMRTAEHITGLRKKGEL